MKRTCDNCIHVSACDPYDVYCCEEFQGTGEYNQEELDDFEEYSEQ